VNVVSNAQPATEEPADSASSSVARAARQKRQFSLTQTTPAREYPDMAEPDVYDDGYLRIEHANYYLACGGQAVYLPRVEFLLVSRLARSIERVVASEDLWRAAWDDRKPLNGASLHVYIHRLRNKLRPYNLQIDVLVNVGYRLVRATN